jgi:hypothetical protein
LGKEKNIACSFELRAPIAQYEDKDGHLAFGAKHAHGAIWKLVTNIAKQNVEWGKQN